MSSYMYNNVHTFYYYNNKGFIAKDITRKINMHGRTITNAQEYKLQKIRHHNRLYTCNDKLFHDYIVFDINLGYYYEY